MSGPKEATLYVAGVDVKGRVEVITLTGTPWGSDSWQLSEKHLALDCRSIVSRSEVFGSPAEALIAVRNFNERQAVEFDRLAEQCRRRAEFAAKAIEGLTS